MKNPLIVKVEEISKSAPIVIFMKGTPQFPQCGFSARSCQVLRAASKDAGVVEELVGVDVLSDDPLWGALEEFTEWPTVPQIFIHGQFVGGCDIICELHESGELKTLLTQKNLA
jgi:monothiol glutaredoxin